MTDDLAEVRRPHIVDGEFQSDKYPTCPRGKVPLSTKDQTAQDLLWKYAQRRRSVDAEFADDLEWALRKHGYTPGLDAEGQTVEGGEDWEAKFKAHTEAVQGFLAEMVAVYDPCASGEIPVREVCAFLIKQTTDDRQRFYDQEAELTRLKAAQSEHDRTVRLATLEEAAKIADSTGSFWRGHPNGAHARAIAKAIRALIDQTGGEGGI